MNIRNYTIVFFFSLLNIQVAYGPVLMYFVSSILQVVFFIATFSNGGFTLFQKEHTKNLRPIFLIFLLITISLIRANSFSFLRTMNFITFQLFVFAYISVIFNYVNENKLRYIDGFRSFIINPFVYYFIFNFIFWFLNIKSAARADNAFELGPAVMLSSLGFYVERVNFLFATGINSYAAVLGGVICYVTMDNYYQKRWNIANIATFSILIFSCLLTDSRSAILWPIVFLGLTLLIKTFNLKFVFSLSPIIFIVIPVAITIILPIIAEIAFFNQFARNETDLFTLNGRLFIWYFAIDEFVRFKLVHILGWGFQGYITAGSSEKWAFLFENSFSAGGHVHPHNSILSILYDIGYLGLGTLLYILAKTSKFIGEIWKKSKENALTYYSLLLYIIFISISEAFIGIYYLNAITLIFCFFIYIFATHTLNQKTTVENHD